MTDYYFDATGGNDGNTGLTPLQAWQTLTKLFNEFLAGTFAGGDNIYFKCGESWTPGAGAYIRIRNVAGTSSTTPLTLSTYDPTAGPRPLFDSAGAFATPILTTGVVADTPIDWVIVENLKIKGGTAQQIALWGASNWTFRNVCVNDIADSDGLGVQLRDSCTDITFIDCDITSDGAGNESLYMGTAGSTADAPTDILIENCYIHDADLECVDLKCGAEHISLVNSTFKRAVAEVVSLRGDNHWIVGNILSNAAGPDAIRGFVVLGQGHDYIITNNLIYDVNGAGGYGLRHEGDNHIVEQNTFADLTGDCIRVLVTATGWSTQRNIYFTAATGMYVINTAGLPAADYNTFNTMASNDLNLVGRGGLQTIAAACAAHGIECNSSNAAPTFTDADSRVAGYGVAADEWGWRAPRAYNAVWFDGVDDYYSIADAAELTLQDGDWCVGCWVWINNNEGSAYQYALSNNNWSVNDSFNLYLQEDSVGGGTDGKWWCVVEDSDGTTVQLTADYRAMDDARWRLIIVQRNTADSQIELWHATENAYPILEDVAADTNFDAVDGGVWNVARRVDGDAARYLRGAISHVFKGDFCFDPDEMHRMALGLPPLSAANEAGHSLDLYLRFLDDDATVYDMTGNGNNATKQNGPVRAMTNSHVCTPMKRMRM